MVETVSSPGPALAGLRLAELGVDNIHAVNQLSVRPGRERFVLPLTYSLAVTPSDPSTSWQRVALDGDEVVGFLHATLDQDPAASEPFRACVWRIFVDGDAQHRGVGTFLIRSFAAAAAAAGIDRITVLWEPGDGGPGDAFHRMGFTDIGETAYGETIAAMPTGRLD